MADEIDPKAVEQSYAEALDELRAVFGSVKSTDAQRERAKAALETLTRVELGRIKESIQARTKALESLMVQLEQVIAAVREKPPYLGALDKFTRIVGQAGTLLGKAPKSLDEARAMLDDAQAKVDEVHTRAEDVKKRFDN